MCVYAAAADVVVNAAFAAAPAAVLLLLLLLLRFLFMLPLFVLIAAEVGAVADGAAAAPASDGASGVAVRLERGNGSLGIPQWRGAKGALGMQWPRLGSVTMGQNIGSCSGTPASSSRGIAGMASRVLLE